MGMRFGLEIFENGKLAEIEEDAIGEWRRYRPDVVGPAHSLESVVVAEHFCNFRLWELEETARRTDVPAEKIAEIKRSTDKWNRQRNDLVERIDELVLAKLAGVDISGASLHSETVGMMADRISILTLRIRDMAEHAGRKDDLAPAGECGRKLDVLKTQRKDLCQCLHSLLLDFEAGRRYFKMYRRFTQHGDMR